MTNRGWSQRGDSQRPGARRAIPAISRESAETSCQNVSSPAAGGQATRAGSGSSPGAQRGPHLVVERRARAEEICWWLHLSFGTFVGRARHRPGAEAAGSAFGGRLFPAARLAAVCGPQCAPNGRTWPRLQSCQTALIIARPVAVATCSSQGSRANRSNNVGRRGCSERPEAHLSARPIRGQSSVWPQMGLSSSGRASGRAEEPKATLRRLIGTW